MGTFHDQLVSPHQVNEGWFNTVKLNKCFATLIKEENLMIVSMDTE